MTEPAIYQVVREMWTADVSGPEIAAKLEVGLDRVYKVARALGLPRRRQGRRPGLVAGSRSYRAAQTVLGGAATPQQAAERFGVSVQVVYRVIKKIRASK